MMADAEIASFLTKFKLLCNAGVNASLNISSCNGKATVTLQADLGPLSKPSIIPQTSPHRSPSYHRRIARRRMMRQSNDVNLNEAGEASIVEEDNSNEAVRPVMGDDAAKTSSLHAEQVCNLSSTDILENVDKKEEMDPAEAEIDKLVEQVIVYAVPPSDCRQPLQTAMEVEEEIRSRFSSLGVEVKSIQMKTGRSGNYESSLVNMSPVNLRKIWGRRLGLSSCAVVEYKPTKKK